MSDRILAEDPTVDRNGHIFDDGGNLVGGASQNGGLTQKDLYSMCDVFVICQEEWRIFHLNDFDASTGAQLGKTRDSLAAGNYVILSPSGGAVTVSLTVLRPPRRVLTKGESSERESPTSRYFKEQVRARDRVCVVSGTEPATSTFAGFQVAHIYPLSRERDWIRDGCKNWISDTSDTRNIGDCKIHSFQNGLLLSSTFHEFFDTHMIAVNPDEGYKIVCFVRDKWGLDGRTLDSRCLTPGNNRVSDDYLRWHYHQAILANMKAAGEAPWEMTEHDGEPIADIIQLPDGALRVETELFNRLGAGDIDSPEIASH